MADNPRIEELRRRIQKDPASIAFAQLAEEYRRAGNYDEAIAICRSGLQNHPSYLSARVTLGRALIEVHALDEAATELRYVLEHAAENLAAIRGMAEIHHRRGELSDALTYYRNALDLARHDPDLEQTISELSRAIVPVAAPVVAPGLSFEEARAEFLSDFNGFEAQPEQEAEALPVDLLPVDPLPIDPALLGLERFLQAVQSYRQRRAV